MPTYEYVCVCGRRVDILRDVDQRNDPAECPRCHARMERAVTMPHIRPDADDFSSENGGKGRYNPQLKQHVTSVNHAIEVAKSKGMYVLDR